MSFSGQPAAQPVESKTMATQFGLRRHFFEALESRRFDVLACGSGRGGVLEPTMFGKPQNPDHAYFLRRALEEHMAAAIAKDHAAALVHMRLAREYERQVSDDAGLPAAESASALPA
jgi:hypothetical protein